MTAPSGTTGMFIQLGRLPGSEPGSAMRLAIVVPSGHPTGRTNLWPRQGRNVEVEVQEALAAIRVELAQGMRYWQRRSIRRGDTVKREYFAHDAIGRETGEIMVVDPEPVHFMDALDWPPHPAPFVVPPSGETEAAA